MPDSVVSSDQAGRGGPWVLPRWLTFGVIPFFLAFAISMALSAYLAVQARSTAVATVSPAPHRSTVAQFMGLSPLSGRVAPGFTLTDQRGATVPLSTFKGKAVLLAFIDSRCTQVCPVLAQEFLLAQHDLGPAASRVAFVAVNVDPMATSVASVQQFTQAHGLSTMPNWYFLTGQPSVLQPVWRAYGITVVVPKNATQTVHAAYLYFIGPSGHERYIASPQVDQRANGTGYLPPLTLTQWGKGIASYLTRTLTA